jgi:hypothetical protein
VASSCVQGNELPGSITGGNFLTGWRMSVSEEGLCQVNDT